MAKFIKDLLFLLIILGIGSVIGSIGVFVFLTPPTKAQSAVQKDILVISKGRDSRFIESINIDKQQFKITLISDLEPFSSIDSEIEVIILFDPVLNAQKRLLIIDFVKNGGSCLIFMGQNLHNDGTILKNLTIIENAGFEKNTESMLFVVADQTHPICRNIDWNSAPDVKPENMTIITSYSDSVQEIVDVYPISKNLEIDSYRESIIVEKSLGTGNIIVFTGWLEEDANVHYTLWPYFNYLLYAITLESLNEEFARYPDWSYSPVPHSGDQIIIGILIIGLTVLAVSLFFIVKKRSKGKIDQATIEVLKRQAEEEERKRIEEAKKLEKKLEEHVDLSNDWEVIGIHRQLGGFFFTFFLALILVIPQLLISNFVLPQIIQPYPQAAGWYYLTYNLFQIAWLLFDFGTAYALAKYFSQYRVRNPEKSIHYIQLFIWWQLFTGLAQITIFAFIGSLVFPQTNLAHMSWVFITFSLVQYPGFFLVFMFTFQGMQRSDYHLLLYVAWEVIWLLVGQMIFTYLGRLWGAANPIFGEALGAGIGYSIARYFDYWMTFILSVVIFKKLGFSIKTCFRIDFTKEEFKETMKYGSRLAFGNSFVQLGWFIQIIITSLFISNYSNELGYFQLASNVAMIVQVVGLYGESLLGAFSESSSHYKKTLTKLYIYQAFRWGNYFSYFIISVLFAVGAKFIVGAAGLDYGGPAVRFLAPFLIFHAFGVYSWLVDAVFRGTGNTLYAALVWILEQTIRAIIMLILVIIFKDMVAVLLAYIPAVLTKDIVAWIIVSRKITHFKVYKFKSFITPGLAAICNYIALLFVGEILWMIPLGNKIVNTALIFILGIFCFLYFYAFMDGFFGGYDNNTIQELERATNMVTGGLGVLPKTLYKAARLGTKISPFHNKLPIDIYELAMKEAYDLTLEKKILKI